MKTSPAANGVNVEQASTLTTTGAELAGVGAVGCPFIHRHYHRQDGTEYAAWNIGYEFEPSLQFPVVGSLDSTAAQVVAQPSGASTNQSAGRQAERLTATEIANQFCEATNKHASRSFEELYGYGAYE